MKRRFKLGFIFSFVLAGVGIALAACGTDTAESISVPDSTNETTSVNDDTPPDDTPEDTPEHVHDWNNPTWAWAVSGNGYKATATFVCKGDATHVTTKEVNATRTVKVDGGCVSESIIEYLATVSFNNKDYLDTKLVTEEPTGHHCEDEEQWSTTKTYHWHECDDCDEKISFAPHNFVTETVANSETASTCTVAGGRQEITYCTVCGYSLPIKNIAYKLANHDYSEVVEDHPATCNFSGYTIYACSDPNCDRTLTINYSPLGHDWDRPEPDCTHPSICNRCHEERGATGHHFIENTSARIDATCYSNGKQFFVCDNPGCDANYSINIEKEAHTFNEEWVLHDERIGNTCEYTRTYTNTCSVCGEPVTTEPETVYKHNEVVRHITEPTCVAPGQYVRACSECGHTLDNPYEVAINEDFHEWEEVSTSAGVTTYRCKHHNEVTKKVVNDNNNLTKDTLAATDEVSIGEFSMVVDANTRNSFGDDDTIALSAGTVDPDDLPQSAKEDTNLNGATVYNFGLNKNGEAVTENFAGTIEVRIPIELNNNDDPDNLVIYYINSAGELERITNVRYENGFAIFNAEHFSYYSVQTLAPEEMCARFNEHTYGENVVVAPTCTEGGYTYHKCTRCGQVETIATSDPLGHDMVIDSSHASERATCTVDGEIYYKCNHDGCNYTYFVDEPATGHSFDDEHSDYQAPTCTKEGSITYTCTNPWCNDGPEDGAFSYTETFAALGHDYQLQIVEATCHSDGSVDYVCTRNHDHVDLTRHKDISKDTVPHNFVLDHEGEEDNVEYEYYVCSEPGCTAETKKPKITFSPSHIDEVDYFNNIAKSIVGEEFTLIGSNGVLEFVDNMGNEMKFSGDDAELHLGLDANKNLVGYGKATFEANTNGAINGGEVAFYIKEGKLYYRFNQLSGSCQYTVIDLDTITMGSMAGSISIGEYLDKIPEFAQYYTDTIKPFLEDILDANKDSINDYGYKLINKLCTVTNTSDGFEININFVELRKFIVKLEEDSIEECFDYLFGEGKLDSLIDDLTDYTSLSLKQALAKLKDERGIDYKRLLSVIDGAIAIFSDYDSLEEMVYNLSQGMVNISTYLSDNFLANNSIDSLIRDYNMLAKFLSDKTLSQFFATTLKEYVEENLFDLILEKTRIKQAKINQIKADILEYFDAVASHGYIGFRTDYEGHFLNATVNLDMTVGDIKVAGNIKFAVGSDYESHYDYASIINACDIVTNTIYQNEFSTREKIIAHFTAAFGEAPKVTPETGSTVLRIEHEYERTNDYYDSKYEPRIIKSEDDVVKYAGKDGYSDLVKIFNQYGKNSNYTIRVLPHTEFHKDIYTHFGPSMVSFEELCGNVYNVNYSVSCERNNIYDGIRVNVYDQNNNLVDTQRIGIFRYGYLDRDNAQENINISDGAYVNDFEHDYQIDKNQTVLATCTTDGREVYYCRTCGKEKVVVLPKGHKHEVITGYALAENVNSCLDGVIVTYDCDVCGAHGLERTIYDRHIYTDDTVTHRDIENGTDVYHVNINKCLCQHDFVVEIEGYRVVEQEYKMNYQIGDIKPWRDLVLYSPVRGEGGDILLMYDEEPIENQCLADSFFVLFFDFDIHSDTPYSGVSQHVSLGTSESHNFTMARITDLHYDADNDRYYVTRTCTECNNHINQNISANETNDFIIPTVDGVEVAVYISPDAYFHNNLDNAMFHGYSFHRGDQDVLIEEKYDNETLFHTEAPNEPFYMRYVSDALVLHKDCMNYRGTALYVNTDSNYENAEYVIYGIHGWETAHTYVNDGATVVNIPGHDLRVTSGQVRCSECGGVTVNSQLEETAGTPYTQSKTVKDGIYEITYAAGYNPVTKTTGERGYVSTYNTQTKTTTVKRNTYNAYCYGNVDNLTVRVYRLESEEVFTSSYKGDYNRTSYYSRQYDINVETGEETLSYYAKESSYKSSDNSSLFRSYFKDMTGFDYVRGKFGCYEIFVNEDSNGRTEYYIRPLEHSDLIDVEAGTCSQPGIQRCSHCGQNIYSMPARHKELQPDFETGLYTCRECNTHFTEWRYDNERVLENLTPNNSNDLVVGYNYLWRQSYEPISLQDLRDQYSLTPRVYAHKTSGENVLLDVNIRDVSEGKYSKFAISKAAIIAELEDASEVNGIIITLSRYPGDMETSIIYLASEVGFNGAAYTSGYGPGPDPYKPEPDPEPGEVVYSVQTNCGDYVLEPFGFDPKEPAFEGVTNAYIFDGVVFEGNDTVYLTSSESGNLNFYALDISENLLVDSSSGTESNDHFQVVGEDPKSNYAQAMLFQYYTGEYALAFTYQ